MDNRFDFFGEQLFEEAKYFLEKAKQEYDLWVLAEEYEEYER